MMKKHSISSRIMMLLAFAFFFALGSCSKEKNTLEIPTHGQTDTTTAGKPVPSTGKEYTFVPDANGRLLLDDSKGQYKGGDILNLKGTFTTVVITNLKGSAGNPIIVRNAPGTVVKIGVPSWNGGSWSTAFSFVNCHYIKVGGSKSKSDILIDGSTQPSREAYFNLTLSSHSDNFEISNITIRNGGTGIWAKTEPLKDDPSTHYPNSTMENLLIHDVEISETYNEAMYIGHTALYWNLTANAPYYGDPSGFTPGQNYVQPIKWRNVKIFNNRVLSGGKDGIQTSAIDQLEIAGNEVTQWGGQHNSGHNGGILIGGRTTNTNVHDNYVHNGWGELIQFYGTGENGATHIIKNNLLRDNEGDGVSLRGTNNAVIQIQNNTIANVGGVCLRINGYQGMKAPQQVKSNAFIQPKPIGTTVSFNAYVYTENGGVYVEGTGAEANTRIPTVAEAGVDTNNFYQPKVGSAILSSGYRK
ncbi:right-handed parallel beta-helix repeat-containing protein [Chitinophaga silvatica]|uniref:Right-handed parallel beta-helix repeat-containing protein n=1 Tax=Chitinophaga silvatica TaxID=2282649 RepID=A0A3E1Y4E1_9BACT|nr:right-handed parallel beta-helix repeat-containing protein [Chitinophaga silvatica]RFS19555.1 right-handed parallel beta-helix repeat-containing protein [Chitinophaga silvatica]